MMETGARPVLLLVSVVIVCSDQLTYVLARKSDCSNDYNRAFTPAPYFDPEYSYLYLKLEEALINDEKLLEKLRAGFISGENKLLVHFVPIQLEVVNGTNDSCDGYGYNNDHWTFCNSNSTDYMWELCPNYYMGTIFSSQSFEAMQLEACLRWLFLLHGCITPTLYIYVKLFPNDGHVPYYYHYFPLRIKELKCNPPIELIKCVLLELLSWVSFVVFGLNHSN